MPFLETHTETSCFSAHDEPTVGRGMESRKQRQGRGATKRQRWRERSQPGAWARPGFQPAEVREDRHMLWGSARGSTRARVTPVPEQPRASPLVPPTIEGAGEGPHLVKAVAGRPLALECVARGRPPPTLSWHHEGRPVVDSNGTWLEAGGGLLSLESLGEASGGRYSCVASSPAGEAVLQYAVDVQGEPRPVPPKSPGLWPPSPQHTCIAPAPQPSESCSCQRSVGWTFIEKSLRPKAGAWAVISETGGWSLPLLSPTRWTSLWH